MAELASAQHGVISLGQLLELGLTQSGVSSRIAAGSLHRIHRGVYAVGHPSLTRQARWLAAVLACGSNAILSHHCALALHALRPTNQRLIDVAVPTPAGRRQPGIVVHRLSLLDPRDGAVVDGIRCTSVARTLLDTASDIGLEGLDRAIAQAEITRVFDLREVEDLIGRSRGRRGVALLRTAVNRTRPDGVSRSELERRLLKLCRLYGLPLPAVNCPLEVDGEWIEVDFAWHRQRLVVETDGRRFHETARAFERDRRRDQALVLAGWRVVRFTWRQLVEEPDLVATRLQRLLHAERRKTTE